MEASDSVGMAWFGWAIVMRTQVDGLRQRNSDAVIEHEAQGGEGAAKA